MSRTWKIVLIGIANVVGAGLLGAIVYGKGKADGLKQGNAPKKSDRTEETAHA